MKRCRLLVAISAMLVMLWSVATAQNKPDGIQPQQIAPPASDRELVLIEPGPVVESTLFDGSVVDLETQTVTRLMWGSDQTGLTLDDLREMVLRAREAFASDPDIITVSGGGPRDGGPRTGLDIVFNVSNPPAGATAALEAAATYIESVFADPITVAINVSFANLGSGVLGSTSNNYAGSPSWSDVRNALIAGMDSDDTIQNWLPSGSTIPVRYNGGSSTVTDETRVFFSVANYNAAIGTQAGTAASMQFNNTFSWDYDPSDGITFGYYCFQSVIIHEVGHVLGFVSGADFRTSDIESIDICRFQRTDGAGDYNPDTHEEFQTTARLVSYNSPDDDHNSDLISVEYRMSDGTPYQASHFRQGSVDGIMQPAIGSGTTFYPNFYRTADIEIFDLVGWDRSPEQGTTTLPFFDDFPSMTLDSSLWTGVEGAQINDLGLAEPSSPYSLNLDGSSGGGDEIRTATIDTSLLTDIVIEYYWQRTGGGDSPESGEDLVVEYRDSSSNWVEIARYLGSGSDMTTYTFVSHTLTAAAALHPNFRVQFRAISSTTGSDDWFIDNVSIYTNTDFVPPSPDPMTFNADPDGTPTPISVSQITMTATEAADPSGGIQYYFTAVGAGSASSGWQTSRAYTNGSLQTNRNYTYTVKARDAALNETATSAAVAVATFIETPTALTFGTVTSDSIVVNAPGTFTRLTSSLSGLYFEVLDPGDNPVGGGDANTWKQVQTITATGLSPGTTYRFRVKARNYYGQNQTPWYPTEGYLSQATQGASCTLLGDMNQDGLVNGLDIGGFVRAKLGGSMEPGENAACAEYGGSLAEDIADFVADLVA